ncbi:hypothetical protein [uncultured Sulfitobacter sp.]|uniref:hypothetical protein n=1 Tax=uncultured Sulfitobacter sp. TaxID=191468 RepID=UPI002615D200|nr:hypothetical protein [uncultured Sulfitobacter sp.]
MPENYCAIYILKEKSLPGISSRVGTYLDFIATVALAASVVLLMVIFADLFTPPSDTVGTHPRYLAALAEAAMFLGLLFMPTIACAIAWPIHVHQKRRGQPVFGWLRFVVLASAAWTWFAFTALSGL